MQTIEIPIVKGTKDIAFGDLLCYGILKCLVESNNLYPGHNFPTHSYNELSYHLGVTKKTVIEMIKRLENAKFIKVERDNNINNYQFLLNRPSEKFSKEFLFSKDLTNQEKEFLIRIQSLFFGKEYPKALVYMSSTSLAEYLGISATTVRKIKNSLQDKHLIEDDSREGFCVITEKTGQYEVLKDHITPEIEEMKKVMFKPTIEERIDLLEKKLSELCDVFNKFVELFCAAS